MPADVKTWSIREIAIQNRNSDVWVWKDLGVHPGESKRRNVHEPHQRRLGLQIVNLGQRDARGGDAGG